MQDKASLQESDKSETIEGLAPTEAVEDQTDEVAASNDNRSEAVDDDANDEAKNLGQKFNRMGMSKIEEMERRIQEEQAMLKARLEARKSVPASAVYFAPPEESKHKSSVATGD